MTRLSRTKAESVLSPSVADLEEFRRRQLAYDSPGMPRSGTHTHTTFGTTVSQVNAFRQAIPELANLRTACIMDGGPLTLARDFKALKVDILSTGKDHVSPDLVADCQRRGIQVWVWTVNSLHFMERLLVSVEVRLVATVIAC